MEIVKIARFRARPLRQPILHLDRLPRPIATCSREQIEYSAESAIRRRFVPALVEVLTGAIIAGIY